MIGKIIIFQLDTKKLAKKDVVKFYRGLYGYIDHSQHGKYQYKRKGMLNVVKAYSPYSSVIISKNEDAERIIDFIKKFTKKLLIRDIILTKEDLEKLK